MEINKENEITKGQIIANLQTMINEVMQALQTGSSFIFSACIDGHQFPISVAGTYGNDEDLARTLETFKKNNNDIYSSVEEALNPKPKVKGIEAEITKKDDGGVIINFSK